MRHEVASEQATAAQAKTTGELPSIQGGTATTDLKASGAYRLLGMA